jgi:hypothetical protein
MQKGLLDNDDTFPVEQTVEVGEHDGSDATNNFQGKLNLSDNTAHDSSHISAPLDEYNALLAGSPTTQANATDDINIKPLDMPMSPGGMQRRAFFDRTFGKLEKGGVRNSVFLLCNAAVGGGVLSLPYMFVLCGYLMGYILMAVSALAGIWSNLILARLAIKHKKSNYNEIVFLAGGPKLQKALQIMLLFYLFGACTGYQIIQTQMVAYIANQFGLSYEDTNTMWFRAAVNIPIDAFIVIPLSAMRDMSSLAFISLLTVLALVYCALLLLIEVPWYNRLYKTEQNFKETVFMMDYNFLQACSMTFFAYTC